MFVYCLQCQTQRCNIIADLLERDRVDRAFSPKIISRHRKKGKIEEAVYDLLPGYVFVYSEQQYEDFELFSGIDGIIRCLGATEYGTAGLQNSDYDFAMSLYQKNGVVGVVTLFKEGDSVRMKDPIFEKYDGTIVYIDHRKQRAKVQFHFDSKEWTIWVACDVLYRDAANPDNEITGN